MSLPQVRTAAHEQASIEGWYTLLGMLLQDPHLGVSLTAAIAIRRLIEASDAARRTPLLRINHSYVFLTFELGLRRRAAHAAARRELRAGGAASPPSRASDPGAEITRFHPRSPEITQAAPRPTLSQPWP